MNSIKIKGISLALVFKKIDDLSVTNSIEENHQKPGGNLGKNNESALGGKIINLHSKTKDETLKCENRQKNSRGREK